MKEFIVTKSSVIEIQNLVVNPKPKLSQTINNTSFYLSKFPAKINDKIFKINKKKTLFCGNLSTKGIFLKNSG